MKNPVKVFKEPALSGVKWESSKNSSMCEPESESIRLLKVLTLFAAGGTEGQVLNLIRNIDRDKFDLQFACLKKWGHFLEEIEQRNIPISEFRIKSFYRPSTFIQQVRFAELMRSQRIQIMHSYNFYSNIFAVPAAKLAGVPVVIASIRDRGVYLTQAQKQVQKWICRMADRILVNAESIREWLIEEGYQSKKIIVIRNGINMSMYNGTKGTSGIREELNILKSTPLVVMLSRLNPQKGVDDFLKAAALVNHRHPEVRFLLIGEKLFYQNGVFKRDAEYHQELANLTCELGLKGKVIFTGHRKDVPELLAEASVSVLPSHSEGLSNTLLESMAAGIPIVATQVGGTAELVENGVNGILVPPKNPEHLAEAINNILDDHNLARRLGRESRKIVRDKFCMERMVQDTQDLYTALISERIQGCGL